MKHGTITKKDENHESSSKLSKKNIISLWLIIYSFNMILYFLTSDKELPILQVLFLNNVFYASIMTVFSYHAYVMFKSAATVKHSLSAMIKTKEDNPGKLTVGSIVKVSLTFFITAFIVLAFVSFLLVKTLL